MSWISVHDKVTGSKLRGLRKRLNCSEAEALGILVLLWLWARKDADLDGTITNTDLEDVEVVYTSTLPDNLRPKEVVTALHEEGWIEIENETLYIHDWEEWQMYSYSHEKQKVKGRERQRRFREKQKNVIEVHESECNGYSNGYSNGNVDTHKNSPKKPKTHTKKPDEENKKKFADFVSMKDSEYQKLIAKFGEPFAEKCVEVLDNYKGSSGKRYKDDYRAILNWVVDRVNEKHPELVHKESNMITGNPFR